MAEVSSPYLRLAWNHYGTTAIDAESNKNAVETLMRIQRLTESRTTVFASVVRYFSRRANTRAAVLKAGSGREKELTKYLWTENFQTITE